MNVLHSFTIRLQYKPLYPTMVAPYNTFASIVEAREAINRHVLDNSESYRVYKLDTKRHILVCNSVGHKIHFI